MTAPATSLEPVRRCQLCLHPDRERFEALLIDDGRPQTEVAALAGISQSCVSRHLSHHVGAVLSTAERAAAGLLGTHRLLETEPGRRLVELRELLLKAMRAAETGGELKLVPRFGREVYRCLELEVRLTGGQPLPGDRETGEAAEQRGAIKALAGVMLAALSDHPEARARVADALAGMAALEGAQP